jgi:alanine racemase
MSEFLICTCGYWVPPSAGTTSPQAPCTVMDEAFAARIAQELANAPSQATGVALIRLGAIRRNYRKLCGMSGAAETAGVVKANAYGLGVAEVFPALEKEGCRTAFVATIAEAQALRANSKAAIYVLDGLLPGTAPVFEEAALRPVLSSLDEVSEWGAYCKARGKALRAAIHVDTGMSRLGLPGEQVRLIAQTPEFLSRFDLRLVMSHLACADDPNHPKNEAQRARFAELSSYFPAVPRSLANSGGILLGPKFHFDLTRPGISLYGGRARQSGANPMEPVIWLFSRIAEVSWAPAGATVGYGAAQTIKRRTRIATAAAGYADGYFRGLSASDAKAGPEGFAGAHRLPLLGRISMDLITFDATDAPEEAVSRGGWIELLGERVSVDGLASYAGTIGYEVLTSLGHRYHRVYVDD